MDDQNRLTVKQIQKYIEKDETELARRKRLFAYYSGEHAINSRVYEDSSRPNARLSHAFPAMISNLYAGYFMGTPVNYTAKQGAEAMLDALNVELEYNDEAAENAALALDASICGAAVEILYTDADAALRFARVDPAGCVAVYDNTIEAPLTALIRYYDVTDVETDKVTRWVEVYDAQSVRVFTGSATSSTLTLTEERPHYFGDVPAVVVKNNAAGTGDFETVISLIDAYDTMQSDAVNDQEYFSDAYLMLKGMDGTEPDDIAKMREKRTLLLPSDGDAAFLIKTGNEQAGETVKQRIDHDIHRLSGAPDMSDESFAGNSSGVAIRYKLLQFEQSVKIKEREFKRALQRRIELMCNFWARVGRGTFDWRQINIQFTRALPQNLLEEAQAMAQLGDVISDETKRALLPIAVDEDTEKQRLKEQRTVTAQLFAPEKTDAPVVERISEEIDMGDEQ